MTVLDLDTTVDTRTSHRPLAEVLGSAAALAEHPPSSWDLELQLAVHELVTSLVREVAAADPSLNIPAPTVLEPPVVYLRTLGHLAQRTAGREVVLGSACELGRHCAELEATLTRT